MTHGRMKIICQRGNRFDIFKASLLRLEGELCDSISMIDWAGIAILRNKRRGRLHGRNWELGTKRYYRISNLSTWGELHGE